VISNAGTLEDLEASLAAILPDVLASGREPA
jgi:hypothetical protein